MHKVQTPLGGGLVVGAANVSLLRWGGSTAVKVLGVCQILTPSLSFNYMSKV
jgi:hypothetical protein